jgi:GST-like protein
MITIFQGEMSRLYGVIDRILADGRPFLAGDYSIGDIMHYPWLKFPLDLKFPDLVKQERVVKWLERIGERPAVKKGMAIPVVPS